MAGKSAMRGKTEAVPRSTKATKRLSVDELVAFMSLPIFYELRTAVDVGILLFDDLDEYDLPEGYSKEDIWRILLAVRKQAAVFVPEDPERTADMWMVTTSSLSFNTEMLEVRSKEDSSLARSLKDMQGSPCVTRFIERTLVRGLADEGIAVDEERVHELFAGAPPLTSLDQWVANYFRLSSDCDSLARRAVTHGLIETLYYELSEGVDLSELPERVLAPLDPRLAPPESQVLMDLVCQRACAAGDDMRFGPVLRLLNISWFFRYFNVLPRLNVLVGLLLRNILALKWGFPVLSWIPEGFDPTLAEAPVDAARYEAVFESWSTDYGFGFDFTPYFELNVCLYLRELEGLAASITYLEQLNEQIERISTRGRSLFWWRCAASRELFCASRRISAHSASPTARPGPISWGSNARGIWCGSRRGAPSPSALIPTCRRRSSSWGPPWSARRKRAWMRRPL